MYTITLKLPRRDWFPPPPPEIPTPMRHLFLAASLASALAPGAWAAPPDKNAFLQEPSLGINLNGPSDYNTELPLVDVFRTARPWLSQNGQGWNQGPEIPLNEHGYPESLPAGVYAESPFLNISKQGHHPTGTYHVFYEGTGDVQIGGVAKNVQEVGPGHLTFEIDETADNLASVQIHATDAADPIRNVRVIMPGFEDNHEEQVFRPGFLEMWDDASVIRFMDWMHTNGSHIESWEDRPRVGDHTYMRNGMPISVMVELANRLDTHAWFCMPYNADDDYVRRFAEEVKATLDEDLLVFVELSNELWNGQFQQTKDAQADGVEAGLADKPWAAGWHQTAKRSTEIFEIWTDVFGGDERLVRTVGAQAANSHIAKMILEFEDTAKHTDAVAIAPYMSFNVKPEPYKQVAYGSDEVGGWTPEKVLEVLEAESLPVSIDDMKKHRALTDQHGVALIAYEGGQHMTARGPAMKNQQLVDLLIEANGHPAMEGIYDRYLQAWADAGGGPFALFASVARWSQHGSWGLVEYWNQDPMSYPKYRAYRTFKEKNQGASAEAARAEPAALAEPGAADAGA